MKLSTFITCMAITMAFAAWLPGCFSENRIQKQLDKIEAFLSAQADTTPLRWGGRYEVPYDTTLVFEDISFVAEVDRLHSGERYTMLGGQGITIVGQYDTNAGIVRFLIERRPIRIKGATTLRTFEEIRRAPANTGSVPPDPKPAQHTALGILPQPSAPWWKVSLFVGLFLFGCWWLDRRFYS